ncbi:MAG TPA: hypothetical protein VG204_14530 [Terriglobia bacterium]|jgi:hypothetical protein|nr:hypothetical protein [Terriglobia bacterium]
MYDTISQVFLAFFVIAYLAFLAALAWWVLGGRLRSAMKNNAVLAPVEREGRAVLGLLQSQGNVQLHHLLRNTAGH